MGCHGIHNLGMVTTDLITTMVGQGQGEPSSTALGELMDAYISEMEIPRPALVVTSQTQELVGHIAGPRQAPHDSTVARSTATE